MGFDCTQPGDLVMGTADQIRYPVYGGMKDWRQIYGIWISPFFFRYVNQGVGIEEKLDMIWMKVCDKMDWNLLPPRNLEVTVMLKRKKSNLEGLHMFLVEKLTVISFGWRAMGGYLISGTNTYR